MRPSPGQYLSSINEGIFWFVTTTSHLMSFVASPHQRQYGFAKVRRGPDADMYSHPSFLRGHPEMLMQLRKCNTVAVRRRQSNGSDSSEGQTTPPVSTSGLGHTARTVSPSPPRIDATSDQLQPRGTTQQPANKAARLSSTIGHGTAPLNIRGYHHFPHVNFYRSALPRPHLHAQTKGANKLALLATVLAATAHV